MFIQCQKCQATYKIDERKIPVAYSAIMPDVEHVYHQFVIVITNRDRVRQLLWEKYQIGTGIHYPTPVHKQEAYAEYNNISCPKSEENAPYLI